eukprot:TRINITY_DN4863_c0_g1_i2.p1 TRINITY_DN4863_c0_g1~~TRINITY_DN4863_c0_g1_i2.p1  ORF type:complete len:198 (+),score=41.05 TRINITY_DN4863_c0_g1_i2:58-594(+)
MHRDIAARNFLVRKPSDEDSKEDGNDETLPDIVLADFGLSRPTDEVYIAMYEKELPWRFVPLETLQTHQSSIQSDIWMLGIAIWQLLSAGTIMEKAKLPFLACKTPNDLKTLLESSEKAPLDFPESCDKFFVDVALRCCAVDADERPTTEDLMDMLNSYSNVGDLSECDDVYSLYAEE